jgi:hypothetical protein
MNTRAAVIELLIELIISVIAGCLASFVLDKADAFLFGLLLFMLIEVIRLRGGLNRTHAAVMLTDAYVRSLSSKDALSELRFLYGLRAGSRLGADVVRVPKAETRDFWRDCVARASSRWFVSTYAGPDETWELGWASAISRSIQRERIDAGCQIDRIFVVDSEEEHLKLLEVMKQQAEIGIKVRWLLKSTLLESSVAKDALEALGTLDVALVDDRWVYRTELDPARHLLGASITDNQSALAQARSLLTEASAKSLPYSP